MNKDCLGTVVYSKAGRDVDRKFIIMDIIDKEYVFICELLTSTLDIKHCLISSATVSVNIKCLIFFFLGFSIFLKSPSQI